jgi:hypothetical protein
MLLNIDIFSDTIMLASWLHLQLYPQVAKTADSFQRYVQKEKKHTGGSPSLRRNVSLYAAL